MSSSHSGKSNHSGGNNRSQGGGGSSSGGHHASGRPGEKNNQGKKEVKGKEDNSKLSKDSSSTPASTKQGGGDAPPTTGDRLKPPPPTTGDRLKPPPKLIPASTAVRAPLVLPPGGLSEAELQEVANLKFEVSEDKLKEIAKLFMLLFRDYPQLDKDNYMKRAQELRRALKKYEMGHLQIAELQHKLKEKDMPFYKEEERNAEHDQEKCKEITETLRDELVRARKKRKDLEDLELLAGEINNKRTRTQIKGQIGDMSKDVERLLEDEERLLEVNRQRAKQARLLMHIAQELSRGLAEKGGSSSSAEDSKTRVE